MQEIPFHIKEKIETYEPVEIDGLTLHPIKVREYRWFQNAQPAIDCIQQSFPVRFLSMPLLSAYFAMDYESHEKGEPASGLFSRAVLFLVLSLRYQEDKEMEDRLTSFGEAIKVSPDDPSQLKAIEFELDGEVRRITPIQFQRLRPILAAQNGIELVSDDANPELVEAELDIAQQNGPELKRTVESLISSVAALSHTEEREIMDWPILKLYNRKRAWDRAFGFLLYGFAECSGAKFKGGNPVPSVFYDKANRESTSLVEVSSVTGGKSVQVSETAPVLPGGSTPQP